MEDHQVVLVQVSYGVEIVVVAVAVGWVPLVHYFPYVVKDAEVDHVVLQVVSCAHQDGVKPLVDEVHLVVVEVDEVVGVEHLACVVRLVDVVDEDHHEMDVDQVGIGAEHVHEDFLEYGVLVEMDVVDVDHLEDAYFVGGVEDPVDEVEYPVGVEGLLDDEA